MSFLEETSKVVQAGTGAVNRAVISAMQGIDFQEANMFEIIFTPKSIPSVGGLVSSLKSGGLSAVGSGAVGLVKSAASVVTNFSSQSLSTTWVADQLVASLLVSSVQPVFSGIEYQKIGSISYAKDITYPEDVTMTLLETELGIARMYVQAWQNEILTLTEDRRVVFKPDQEGSKKNCFIIPIQRNGLPSASWIKMVGVKYKGIAIDGFDTEGTGPIKPTLTLSVDSVAFNVIGR